MLGFVLGFLYGSFLEYFIHRYVFHKMGKKRGSIFSYHLRGHHKLAAKNNFIDLTTSRVEFYGLIILVLLHLPIVYVSFGFWMGVTVFAIFFKILHGIQHARPSFTKKYMKWHWDHHMKTPNKNFGVVVPWMDYIFGTRKKYLDKK